MSHKWINHKNHYNWDRIPLWFHPSPLPLLCLTTDNAFCGTLIHSNYTLWHFHIIVSPKKLKKTKPPKVNPLNTFILSVLSVLYLYIYIFLFTLCSNMWKSRDITGYPFFYKMLESKKKFHLHLLFRKCWGLDRLKKSYSEILCY